MNEYVWLVRQIYELTTRPEPREINQLALRALLDARIYVVPASTYAAAYTAADEALRRDYSMLTACRDEADYLAYVASRAQPLSGPLPFPATLMLYSSPKAAQEIPDPVRVSRDRLDLLRHIESDHGGKLLGHLIFGGTNGTINVLEFFDIEPHIWICRIAKDGSWKRPNDARIFALPQLLKLLTDPRHVSRHALTNMDSHVIRKAAKKSKLPIRREPYYMLHIAAREARSCVARAMPRRPPRAPSFSSDQAAHRRLLVQRGELPCPPETCLALLHRGYSYWSEGEPGPAWQLEMKLRGHEPKRADEWIALLMTPVKAGRKRKSLPYRPAVRVLSAS